MAGYAIVRYSQAASERGVRYPVNGLEGGTAVQNKGNVQIRVATQNNPVATKVGAQNLWEATSYPNLAGKWVCAEVWVGNKPAPRTGAAQPGGWNYQLKSVVAPLPGPASILAIGIGYSNKTYSKQNNWDRQCVRVIANSGVPIKQVIVDIRPTPGTNFLGVSKVWWQDNL